MEYDETGEGRERERVREVYLHWYEAFQYMLPWWRSVKISLQYRRPGRCLGQEDPLCVSKIVSCSVVSDSLWPPWAAAPSGSSVHEILQVKILEEVVISFSRGSSWPRDQTQASCTADRFFTIWTTREPQNLWVSIEQ